MSGRAIPRVLDEGEQEDFLAEFNTRYWTPHRDRTLCLVMLDAGLRVSEAVSLKLDHLDLPKRRLLVREGKGGKDRQVRICPRLASALKPWLDRRPEALEEETEFVFPTRTGRPPHPNQIRKSVKRAARSAGLSEAGKVTPHTLRHTAAVDLLRETERLELVQDFLGHADVSTTRIYARCVNKELDRALDGFREAEDDRDDSDLEALLAEASPEQVEFARQMMEALA